MSCLPQLAYRLLLAPVALLLLPAAAFAQNTWLGAPGTVDVWSNRAEWSFGTVPDGSTDILIPAGGVSGDTTFTNSHVLAISSPAELDVTAATTIANAHTGVIDLSGRLLNSGLLFNELSANLNITTAGNLLNRGTLVNRINGTITDVGGEIRNQSGGNLTNDMSSTILIQNTLGRFTNEAGATLSNFGTFTITSFKGGTFNAGTFTNFSFLTSADFLSNQGTFTNSGTMTTSAPVINGGTLDNLGVWTDGESVRNGATGVLNNKAGAVVSGFATIENSGQVKNQGTILSHTIENQSGGSFTNAAGATLDNKSLGDLRNELGATFVNAGTIVQSEHHRAFVNLGTFSNSGTIVTNDNNLFNGGTFDNAGTITQTSSFIENQGTLKNSGFIDVSPGSFSSFRNSGMVTNSGAIEALQFDNSGQFDNRAGGDLQISQFTDGIITTDAKNSGALTNFAGSKMTIQTDMTSNGVIRNAGALENRQLLTNNSTLTSSGAILNSGTLVNGGSFTNDPHSSVVNAKTGILVGDAMLFGGTLRNDGVVGSLTPHTLAVVVSPTGTLSGTGIVEGDVLMQGTMSPGDSPGKFFVDGNYTQAASGTFLEEIAGTGTGQFDQLSVFGNIALAGTIEVGFLDGFTGSLGDTFTIISYGGTRTGTFSFGDLPDLGPSLGWSLIYDDPRQDVILSIVQGPGNPVPEPGTLLLLLAGSLSGVAARRIRKDRERS